MQNESKAQKRLLPVIISYGDFELSNGSQLPGLGYMAYLGKKFLVSHFINMIQKAYRSKLWIVYLVLALIVVNYIVSQFHFRLDLTKEKRFTITQPTRELLNDLDE